MRHVGGQAGLYRALLRLYPHRYRTLFGAEMLAVFTESARERRRHGWLASVVFVLAEVLGVLEGAAVEWQGKWTSRDYLAATHASETSRALLPAELREAERNLEVTLSQMVEAIAHHQFQQARSLSAAEHDAREKVRLLRERFNLRDVPAA